MTDQRGARAGGEPELPIGDVDASGVPLPEAAARQPGGDDDAAVHDDGTDADTDDLTVQGGE